MNVASSGPDNRDVEGIAGSSKVYHWGSGCRVNFVDELRDIFFGSTTGSGLGTSGVFFGGLGVALAGSFRELDVCFADGCDNYLG